MALVLVLAYGEHNFLILVYLIIFIFVEIVSAQESTTEATGESTTSSSGHRFRFNSISEGREKALKKVKELLAKAGLKHKQEESEQREKRGLHHRQPIHHQQVQQVGCQPDYVVEYIEYEYEPQYYCY